GTPTSTPAGSGGSGLAGAGSRTDAREASAFRVLDPSRRPATSATAPEPATTPTVRSTARRSGPGPDPRSGRLAVSSRSISAESTRAPTTAATALGRTDRIVASGRVTAAIAATVP